MITEKEMKEVKKRMKEVVFVNCVEPGLYLYRMKDYSIGIQVNGVKFENRSFFMDDDLNFLNFQELRKQYPNFDNYFLENAKTTEKEFKILKKKVQETQKKYDNKERSKRTKN